MRRNIKVPRILKIEKIDAFRILCMFNNGELRWIDFNLIFDQWGISDKDIEFPLLNKTEFEKVELSNHTLSWKNIKVNLLDENGKEKTHPFEIDPLVLYNLSQISAEDDILKFGHLIRHARKSAGLTQEQLADRSGTSRFYISRIENNKTDIELSTFRRIVEAGLGKQLKLVIE